jgi:hypothetical protein
MKHIVALLTVFLALVSSSPALAQSAGDLGNRLDDALGGIFSPRMEREDRRGGGRGDILSGLSREYRRLHGDRVHASDATMIFRADDGKTYSVDMSALNPQVWQSIELGQAVTLAAKPGHEPNTLVAARLQADPSDRSTGKGPKKPFVSAQGTVEAVRDSQFRFRTTDGNILWADMSEMPGRAAARVNDQGTLTYELGPRQQVTALWLERQETQPSAAVSPRAVGPGEYQRLYGYVQSAHRSLQTRRTAMRHAEAFVLGAMIGAVAVWLWGRNIADRITEQTRAIRTKAADGIQAVEETIRPAVNR